jgi:CRISPR system Cascade subunit CasE
VYFSRIELRRDTHVVYRVGRALTGDGYRLHQALWRLFQDERRNFLYRRIESMHWPCFYIVSLCPPQDQEGIWSIQVKDYAPRLVARQRLAFSLRANPVVTKVGPTKKPVRHDVVMDVKTQSRQNGGSIAQAELIQEAGYSWLSRRAEKNGFRLEVLRASGYRQHRLLKVRSQNPIRFSTLELDGVLTVTEPNRLRQTLFYGIGPAKAFGCGLLLVRRI